MSATHGQHLASSAATVPRAVSPSVPSVTIRPATQEDAPVLHDLVMANVAEWHLLPRDLEELTCRASNFLVATTDDRIVGCAELAPLSGHVCEIRSYVIADAQRGAGIGARLIRSLLQRARSLGFKKTCAFAHDPTPFLRRGFSIVPHVWIPEKIATDCTACSMFRRCGQYAVILRIR